MSSVIYCRRRIPLWLVVAVVSLLSLCKLDYICEASLLKEPSSTYISVQSVEQVGSIRRKLADDGGAEGEGGSTGGVEEGGVEAGGVEGEAGSKVGEESGGESDGKEGGDDGDGGSTAGGVGSKAKGGTAEGGKGEGTGNSSDGGDGKAGDTEAGENSAGGGVDGGKTGEEEVVTNKGDDAAGGEETAAAAGGGKTEEVVVEDICTSAKTCTACSTDILKDKIVDYGCVWNNNDKECKKGTVEKANAVVCPTPVSSVSNNNNNKDSAGGSTGIIIILLIVIAIAAYLARSKVKIILSSFPSPQAPKGQYQEVATDDNQEDEEWGWDEEVSSPTAASNPNPSCNNSSNNNNNNNNTSSLGDVELSSGNRYSNKTPVKISPKKKQDLATRVASPTRLKHRNGSGSSNASTPDDSFTRAVGLAVQTSKQQQTPSIPSLETKLPVTLPAGVKPITALPQAKKKEKPAPPKPKQDDIFASMGLAAKPTFSSNAPKSTAAPLIPASPAATTSFSSSAVAVGDNNNSNVGGGATWRTTTTTTPSQTLTSPGVNSTSATAGDDSFLDDDDVGGGSDAWGDDGDLDDLFDD